MAEKMWIDEILRDVQKFAGTNNLPTTARLLSSVLPEIREELNSALYEKQTRVKFSESAIVHSFAKEKARRVSGRNP